MQAPEMEPVFFWGGIVVIEAIEAIETIVVVILVQR